MARRCEDRFISILLVLRGSAARPARRVDGNAVSSDRIENGHEQLSPVQTQGQRRACGFDIVLLKLWLRYSYRDGWSLLGRASCGYHCTALVSDHGHIPVGIAHSRVSAAEQPMQR
jgi:hypothetical protein